MHNTTFNSDLIINTYRWGLVPAQKVAELREAAEAKAKAKVARTGEPVTIRVNVGMYEIFTTSGHYQVEKELDLDHYGEKETGWWICSEYIDGWVERMEVTHPTLRAAKTYLLAL
jgi:hypothetical protein